MTTGYTLTLSLSEAQMTIGRTLRLTAVVTQERPWCGPAKTRRWPLLDAAGNVKALKEGTVKNYRFAGRRRKTASCGDYKSGGSSAAASDFCARCGACGQANPKTGV